MSNDNRDRIIKNNLATWLKAQAARNAPVAPPASKPKTAADLKMKPRAKDAKRPDAVGTNGGAPGTGISGLVSRDVGRKEVASLMQDVPQMGPIPLDVRLALNSRQRRREHNARINHRP